MNASKEMFLAAKGREARVDLGISKVKSMEEKARKGIFDTFYFTAVDSVQVWWHADRTEYSYSHNGVDVTRERALELVG